MQKKRLEALDAYFRAANFLSVGQIYLKENTLLNQPLKPQHIKPRLLGHWGTSPGLNLIYAHLNRLIQDTNAKMIYITGPGHGGPALRANVFLEGTMTEIYPDIKQDKSGIEKLMREFSWPGGVPSHVSPQTPGSINEGGELGYSIAHAVGAVFDNPDLIAACIVGDGEAETGPLAASWQFNKFLNPKSDGAVLPILHLNGYKISGPTIFGRMGKKQLEQYFKGCGYKIHFVEGNKPMAIHKALWKTLDTVYREIRSIQSQAKKKKIQNAPTWPLIIIKTPKGWTGPKIVDGKKIEGTFRSHQVPISDVTTNKDHLKILEHWMKSYHPEKLFEENGKPRAEILSLVPKKALRMGASPYANGGMLLKDLKLPNPHNYAIDVPFPGGVIAEATNELGKFVRDIFKCNEKNKNFRLFCPDETQSNRFGHVFEATKRMYLGPIHGYDDNLAHDGRVMEVLSEHLCQGWLEGYLLTGRHGIFPCYEAFALIIDSMVNQHGKWLKICQELPWRKPISSLNYILTSHAWRQDHNGFSHQGPGFIESILQKKANIARIYLPPDANCLLSISNHCFRSKNYINLTIIGKQPMPQWLTMEEAENHCAKGASIWKWASNDEGSPDVVMVASGDIPTLETLAAISYLKQEFPELRVRMVNVVDLFTIVPRFQHSHGFDDKTFSEIFTDTAPIVFAFHGHPRVIHELMYKRPNQERFHVHGYIEEGTTTTPFDMVVCNNMSRFHLALAALQCVPRMKTALRQFKMDIEIKLNNHKDYIYKYGEDMPEIRNWKWTPLQKIRKVA